MFLYLCLLLILTPCSFFFLFLSFLFLTHILFYSRPRLVLCQLWRILIPRCWRSPKNRLTRLVFRTGRSCKNRSILAVIHVFPTGFYFVTPHLWKKLSKYIFSHRRVLFLALPYNSTFRERDTRTHTHTHNNKLLLNNSTSPHSFSLLFVMSASWNRINCVELLILDYSALQYTIWSSASLELLIAVD